MEQKRWLIVSTNAINDRVHPVVVRVTEKVRTRTIDSAVEVEPDSENNLAEVSYVLCHDILTLPREEIGDRFGRLAITDLVQVELALRYVLSL